MGLGPGGLDNHKDHIRALIEKVSPRTIILRLWECTLRSASTKIPRMRQEYITLEDVSKKHVYGSADGGQLLSQKPSLPHRH